MMTNLRELKLKSLYVLIYTLVILNSCNYRTPSKKRFEKVTKIELSDSIIVTEDWFESVGPDYGLFYKFDLNEKDCLGFKLKIEQSGGWINKDDKWIFYKAVDGIIYNITFLLKKCEVSYKEELI